MFDFNSVKYTFYVNLFRFTVDENGQETKCTNHNALGQQVLTEQQCCRMTSGGNLAVANLNRMSREQPQQPVKLIQQVRPGHCRDGIDGSIDGSLQGETVRV